MLKRKIFEKCLEQHQLLGYRALSRRDTFLDNKVRMVWRLENDQGHGPFKLNPGTFNGAACEIIGRRIRPLLYLKPYDDFSYNQLEMIGFNDQYGRQFVRFGFATLNQFYKWFTPQEYKELKNLGFKLKKVPVIGMIVSDNQCIYVPYKSVVPVEKRDWR